MKKYIILTILIFFLYEFLNHPNLVIESSHMSAKLWFNNIFPTLLPFFTLSSLLINYGFIDIISKTIHPIFNKLFKISKSGSYVIIMSLFSGIPGNAKYITDLYNKGYIDDKEGTKLLCFTFFSNPLFILGALSLNMLNNKDIGYLILICHYFPNLIIGLFLRNKYKSTNTNYNKRISNDNFGKLITNSLISSINTLLLILGIISIFSLLIVIINNNFNVNITIVSSILEITQGLNNISLLDISLKYQVIFSTMTLSFGGLSSHMQIISIISNTNIKYIPFLVSRIIHAFLSLVLVLLLYNLF